MDMDTYACVEPDAPVVQCCVCGKDIKTCERDKPIKVGYRIYDYVCPAHPAGAELSDGRWVCSYECWDVAVA
jgi:hypothetical protein